MSTTLAPPDPYPAALSDQPPPSPSSMKRQREDSVGTLSARPSGPDGDSMRDVSGPGSQAGPADAPEPLVDPAIATRFALEDAIPLLERFDPSPSVLHHTAKIVTPEPQTDGADTLRAPASKRLRKDDAGRLDAPPAETATIAQQIKDGRFKTSTELANRIHKVAAQMKKDDEALQGERGWQSRVRTLEREATRIHTRVSSRMVTRPSNESEDPMRQDEEVIKILESGSDGDSILTVMAASAPGQRPRPLFSSVQLAKTTYAGGGHKIEERIPLVNEQLPTAVSTTQLMPAVSDLAKQLQRTSIQAVPSFGGLFKPGNMRLKSTAPKPSTKFTASNKVVTFVRPEYLSTYDRGIGGYNWSKERLEGARWLNYGGPRPHEAIDIPGKLNMLMSKPLPSDRLELEDRLRSEADLRNLEQALFQSAFSSFAPTVDNSDAVLSSSEKGEYWWYRFGKVQFEDTSDWATFAADQKNAGKTTDGSTAKKVTSIDDVLDPALLGQMLETFDPEEAENFEKEQSASQEKFESDPAAVVSKKLAQISEMLQTLHSYQRIRLASKDSALSNITGTPTTPAAAETELYNEIRTLLADTVRDIPPYALAKAGGDQLADLAINTVIPIRVANAPGMLDEDHVARLERAAAAASVAASNMSVTTNSVAGAHAHSGSAISMRGSSVSTPGTVSRHGPVNPQNYTPTVNSGAYPTRSPAPGRGPVPAPHFGRDPHQMSGASTPNPRHYAPPSHPHQIGQLPPSMQGTHTPGSGYMPGSQVPQMTPKMMQNGNGAPVHHIPSQQMQPQMGHPPMQPQYYPPQTHQSPQTPIHNPPPHMMKPGMPPQHHQPANYTRNTSPLKNVTVPQHGNPLQPQPHYPQMNGHMPSYQNTQSGGVTPNSARSAPVMSHPRAPSSTGSSIQNSSVPPTPGSVPHQNLNMPPHGIHQGMPSQGIPMQGGPGPGPQSQQYLQPRGPAPVSHSPRGPSMPQQPSAPANMMHHNMAHSHLSPSPVPAPARSVAPHPNMQIHQPPAQNFPHGGQPMQPPSHMQMPPQPFPPTVNMLPPQGHHVPQYHPMHSHHSGRSLSGGSAVGPGAMPMPGMGSSNLSVHSSVGPPSSSGISPGPPSAVPSNASNGGSGQQTPHTMPNNAGSQGNTAPDNRQVLGVNGGGV